MLALNAQFGIRGSTGSRTVVAGDFFVGLFATAVEPDIVEDRHRLVVTVADDGGGGADPARGSGLRGLADRLAAIGGTLTVTSPPGHGTIVRAELPLA